MLFSYVWISRSHIFFYEYDIFFTLIYHPFPEISIYMWEMIFEFSFLFLFFGFHSDLDKTVFFSFGYVCTILISLLFINFRKKMVITFILVWVSKYQWKSYNLCLTYFSDRIHCEKQDWPECLSFLTGDVWRWCHWHHRTSWAI